LTVNHNPNPVSKSPNSKPYHYRRCSNIIVLHLSARGCDNYRKLAKSKLPKTNRNPNPNPNPNHNLKPNPNTKSNLTGNPNSKPETPNPKSCKTG